jgi:hypothetical protein
MSRTTLLIAGPLALDDFPNAPGLLGGGGGYAAMAAAPIADTQLWARGGADILPQVKSLLTQRGVDVSGVTWEGSTPRFTDGTFHSNGTLLPEVEPTDPEELGAVLVIDLNPSEGRRALAAIKRLPRSDTRPLIISPRPEDCLADPAWLSTCAEAADVLILSADLVGKIVGLPAEPLSFMTTLQKLGAKCICLTNGCYGGVVAYQNKVTTWPALPVEAVEKTGVRATFSGVLAAVCAHQGKADFACIKRGLGQASAAASITIQGIGPRKLLQADGKEMMERFNRLRRAHKF